VEEVKRAVLKEMDGLGRLLGYRALHKKIRELHGLNVPRNLVYNMMADVNPKGLEERGGVGQPKRARRKTAFTSTEEYSFLLEFAQARSFSSSVSFSTFRLVFLVILRNVFFYGVNGLCSSFEIKKYIYISLIEWRIKKN